MMQKDPRTVPPGGLSVIAAICSGGGARSRDLTIMSRAL